MYIFSASMCDGETPICVYIYIYIRYISSSHISIHEIRVDESEKSVNVIRYKISADPGSALRLAEKENNL